MPEPWFDGTVQLIDLVVEFAGTGHLGSVECGMTLAEVEERLGPFHDRAVDRRPRRWRPRLYLWDDLELSICHGLVIGITVPTWREDVQLPRRLCGWREPERARLTMDMVTSALGAVGVAYVEDARLVLDEAARRLRVPATDVGLVFWADDHGEDLWLYNISKYDPTVDDNDHRPRQGRLERPT